MGSFVGAIIYGILGNRAGFGGRPRAASYGELNPERD